MLEIFILILLVINTGLLVKLLMSPGTSKSYLSGGEEADANYLLDTSAIIDGRISEVVQSGFMPGTLIIPQFVLAELQHIADSSDELRRQRGRFGLELVRKLQSLKTSTVEIISDDPKGIEEVDDKLVQLAQELDARVVTTDFNLNRIATIQNVTVLNVNELAQNLRPVTLPGEHVTIKLVQKGSDKGQGVGYLEDGTMVVVEQGQRHISKEVEVEITRIMQTVAGKMMFAQLKLGKSPQSKNHKSQSQKPNHTPRQIQTTQQQSKDQKAGQKDQNTQKGKKDTRSQKSIS